MVFQRVMVPQKSQGLPLLQSVLVVKLLEMVEPRKRMEDVYYDALTALTLPPTSLV